MLFLEIETVTYFGMLLLTVNVNIYVSLIPINYLLRLFTFTMTSKVGCVDFICNSQVNVIG